VPSQVNCVNSFIVSFGYKVYASAKLSDDSFKTIQYSDKIFGTELRTKLFLVY